MAFAQIGEPFGKSGDAIGSFLTRYWKPNEKVI